jgi:methylthioribose-1-phosphate isomerase
MAEAASEDQAVRSGTSTPGSSAPPPGPPAEPALAPALAPDAAPAAAPDAGPPVDPVDLGRRRFFRQLASDVFQTAATVVGAASALQQSSIQAASAILDPDAAFGALAGAAPESVPAVGFRTAFRMEADRLVLVDQRRLPSEVVEFECRTGADVAWAIREMVVRGAPAIGQAAAYGLAMTARRVADLQPFARRATIRAAASALENARPTAVNLRWALDRMRARMDVVGDLEDSGEVLADALRAEADAICAEATRDHSLMAEHGLAFLPEPPDRALRVLTHCNTGPLAGGQFGTALGVVQAAFQAGRRIHVHVDETRPYLQGARLTAWELEQAGVPYTIIPDGAAGALLATGTIDAVLVGADRIAANGDTANKIGTYPLAVLAARHRVPFFVCAPLSSVDLDTADGTGIHIEQRNPKEVLEFSGLRIAPPGAGAWNPAFDITPAELISTIVTEEGCLRAPFGPALAAASAAKAARDPVALPSSPSSAPVADAPVVVAAIADGPDDAERPA